MESQHGIDSVELVGVGSVHAAHGPTRSGQIARNRRPLYPGAKTA